MPYFFCYLFSGLGYQHMSDSVQDCSKYTIANALEILCSLEKKHQYSRYRNLYFNFHTIPMFSFEAFQQNNCIFIIMKLIAQAMQSAKWSLDIDGSVQDCSISIANAL